MDLSRLARQCPECPGTAHPALQKAGPGLVCDECGEAWELGRLPIGHQILLNEWGEQQASRSISKAASLSAVSHPSVIERAKPTNSSSKIREEFSKRFWLKAHQIELLSLAQSRQETVERRDAEGRLVEVVWHRPKSQEALRFRSTLELRQHRKRAERKPKIVWVKEEELAAASEALQFGRTIELGPNGERGRVEFYPEDSEMAKKYLAQICVVRTRH